MNTVLFDLDGTLLPMDMKEFIDTYIFLLGNRLTSSGYDSEKIIEALWVGQKAMVKNDGIITNEECFWKYFGAHYKKLDGTYDYKFKRKLEKELSKFYKEDFGVARFISHPSEAAYDAVKILKEKGYHLVLATNPIFPQVCTDERIAWAGLDKEDFDLVTTYENSCFSKPNLDYYRHILKTIDKDPEDCLMVGNDVEEDMCARKLGLDVFFINTYAINNVDEDISTLKQGNWNLFKEYVSNLPSVK